MRKTASNYLVNPNTGGTTWWYVTDDPHPEFRVGDADHRFTWFGGVREDWDDFGEFNLALRKKYLLEVRIKIPAGCTVFDARSLFPNVPQWVRESLRESTLIDAEELESEEGYDFIFAGITSMAIEKSTYKYFQDLNITEPSLEAILSTFDINRRTEYLIRLWLLDYDTVQSFLETSKYTEEVDTPIVGWYEIERIDYNYHASINIGLFMSKPANRASRDQGCSNIKVDIVNVISAE